MTKTIHHLSGALALPLDLPTGLRGRRLSAPFLPTRLPLHMAGLLLGGTLAMARVSARGLYRLFVPAW